MVFSEPVEIEGCLDFPLMTDGGFPLSHNFYVHMHVSFTHVNKTEDNIRKVTCKRKWNMSRPPQSRTYKQITFGVTVCYNGMSGTLLEHVFLSRVHTYMQLMVKYLPVTYK